jgi:hypothetical protein
MKKIIFSMLFLLTLVVSSANAQNTNCQDAVATAEGWTCPQAFI